MSKRGLISIERSMLSHHIVGIGSKDRFCMWVWLLCAARWKPSRIMVDGEEIALERGQVFVSIRTFASETGVSKGVAERFIRDLKSGTMIETVNKTRGTLITICNYSEYQDFEAYRETDDKTGGKTVTGQRRDSGGTAAGHKRNQTKPDKPEKPDEIEEARGISMPAPELVDQAFEFFCETVKGSNIPIPRKLTADRRRKLKAKINEHGERDVAEAIRKMRASDFCNGKNDRGWIADLDFLFQAKSFNRLLEGGYDNRTIPKQMTKTQEAGARFIQRGYDHDSTERSPEGNVIESKGDNLRDVLGLPKIGRA